MASNSQGQPSSGGLLETDVYRNLITEGTAALNAAPPPQLEVPAIGAPPNFPPGIPVARKIYTNWALSLTSPSQWVATPANEADCVTLANWAAAQKWTLRPSGAQHGFSPLLIPNGGWNTALLVDTSALQTMSFETVDGLPAATFGVGVSMDAATEYLEGLDNGGTSNAPGYGFQNYPAPGVLTIGGVCAIGGHGTGGPEAIQLNGCLSNLILSFNAVVSDGNGTYSVQTFDRNNADAPAMILHLGRAFVTQVTMRVVPNYYLQVQNSYPTAELLFGTGTGTGSFQQLVQEYGRVEVIWYPFTDNPWVKCWSVQTDEIQPQVTGPYNYPLANNISLAASLAIQAGLNLLPSSTPDFNKVGLFTTQTIIAPAPGTMNGTSRDLLLYVKNTTLRVTAIGYAWQCNHNDIQPIVNGFWTKYNQLLSSYQAQGKFPMNAPTEIRCTTMDYEQDLPPNSLPPALSICNPANSNFDTVCWIQSLTMAATPDAYEFMQELEQYYIDTWGPSAGGTLRPEWSKGWAFTNAGPGTNQQVIQQTIPQLFGTSTFASAKATYEKYDASRIYTDTLLNLLFPPST
ncbi:MAG TPA: cholesterol oxidase substrate-binding domain-containing protein [Thermoanaerobaculia bacterium]